MSKGKEIAKARSETSDNKITKQLRKPATCLFEKMNKINNQPIFTKKNNN